MFSTRNGKAFALTVLTAFPLNATPVGSTNDNTLRWDLNVLSAGGMITVADSAVDGTSFLLRAAGFWTVEFMLPQLASTSLLCAISLAGTNLTANPVQGAGGMIATFGPYTLPAATALGVYCCSTFHVGSDIIGPGGNGATVRTHATDNAGATPAPSITEAGSWLKISYVADVQ